MIFGDNNFWLFLVIYLKPTFQFQFHKTCDQQPPHCPSTKYRSYDGSCNNLFDPLLGSSGTPYNRLLPPKYADGINSPPKAQSGNDLPLSRQLSLTFYPNLPIENHKYTLSNMQYGQFIAHDMSLTRLPKQKDTCCTDDAELTESSNECFQVFLPHNDHIRILTGKTCWTFQRTLSDNKCVKNQPAEQISDVTHFLDLSTVYGSSDGVNKNLREFKGGRLMVEKRDNQDWPPRVSNVTETCNVESDIEPCYLAGDIRANQSPHLTLLHVIFVREHNRIAEAIAELNLHWDDETVFQEARKINIAQNQAISYYEWLPLFIGFENAIKKGILYQTEGYVNDYNISVNPNVLNEHATAAYRYFHTLVVGRLNLVNENRRIHENIWLSNWYDRPAILEKENNFDQLCRGLYTQHHLASNSFHDSEITQYLFKGNQRFGTDLKSFDIQRSRDHGLASYNDYREFCGLKKAKSFFDLLDVISPWHIIKLKHIYESVDDIDLSVGGSLEKHDVDTLAGPTFICILTEQFYRTRVGDRFWFENAGDTGFTLEQLNEIRKASISRLMCDNTIGVTDMQPKGFEAISEMNKLTKCEDLPKVDLSKWKTFTNK